MDLVGLLRWKAKKREIPKVLTSLLKIDGEEIVKVGLVRSEVSLVGGKRENSNSCVVF